MAVVCLAVAVGSTATASDVRSPTAPIDGANEDASEADSLAGSNLDVLQGDDAVRELVETDTLHEVAEDVRMKPEELVAELLDDPSLFLAGDGSLGYADARPLDAVAPGGGQPAALALGVDAFQLRSRPTSSLANYLDFDGHVTNDAAWQFSGYPSPIESASFDLDGSPSSFSAAERAAIVEIWQRVSEDFAPFDVNVTTADPGVEALRRTSSNDSTYGQRIVVSPTNFVGATTLGIALVGVFDAVEDRPGFVFSSGVSLKTIAEAASHEAGHTLGLSHDATASSSYYFGHGAWAPIMGRSG